MLVSGTDYSVSYKNNKNVGTATMTITGTGDYTGTIAKTFKILQAKNSITKVTTSKKIAFKKLKKNQSFTIKATVKEKAKLSFKLKSVPKKAKKYITISKSGKVTVKKGLAIMKSRCEKRTYES